MDGNSLRFIRNVGREPAEMCTRNSIEVLKPLKENVVINGVERSRQIKKSYDSYIATVHLACRISSIILSRAVSVLCPGL